MSVSPEIKPLSGKVINFVIPRRQLRAYKKFSKIETKLKDVFSNLGAQFTIVDSKLTTDAIRLIDRNSVSILNHGKACLRPSTRWVINFKEGYLPEYFRLDSTGYSGWSSLPSQFEIEKYSYDDFKKLKLAHVPKASVNLRPRPYIVFFSQLPSDTVMSISNFTQAEILESLVKYGEKFCCDVFLKIHPVYMKRIKKNIQSVRDHEFEFCIADFIKKGRVQLIDESVHSLAQSAKAIFTTNSTTGFESLLHEKPVFTFANSDYQLATYRTKTSEWALWEDVIKNHEKKSIIADFVLTYLNKYSFNYEEKGLEGKIIKYMTQYFRARDSAHRSKECQSMNSQTILANICDNLF